MDVESGLKWFSLRTMRSLRGDKIKPQRAQLAPHRRGRSSGLLRRCFNTTCPASLEARAGESQIERQHRGGTVYFAVVEWKYQGENRIAEKICVNLCNL